MPMVPDVVAETVKGKIKSMLSQKFSDQKKDNPDASKSWEAIAEVAAETAKIIIETIQRDAQVMPGISITVNPGIATTPAAPGAPCVTVTPGAGVTASPGKIT